MKTFEKQDRENYENQEFKGYEPESEEEVQFLREYDPSKFPITVVTVDTVIVQWFTTLKDEHRPYGGEWRVLLVKRAGWPYKGYWALPGGFIDPGETAMQAAIREVKEEAGLDLTHILFKTIADKPERDPRGRAISMVFEARANGIAFAGDDASEAEWFSYRDVMDMDLAFDHLAILGDVLGWPM